MRCFDVISEEVWQNILKNFNLLERADTQDSYLCGLISVLPATRRPRNPADEESTVKQAM